MSSASVDALQPRRELGPFVMTEIGMRRPRRHDQVVVRDRPVRQDDRLPRHVDARGLGQHHLDVLLPAQDAADRRGDVARVQRRRRDLVQQGLKQVMILAVDQDHPHRRAPQHPCGVQAAEPASHDHHRRPLVIRRHRFTTEDAEKIPNKKKSFQIPLK